MLAHHYEPRRRVTQALIHALKAAGGVRKTPGRVPRQQQPDAIRVAYYRALHPWATSGKKFLDRELPGILDLFPKEPRADTRMDAGKEKELKVLVDRAAGAWARAFRPDEFYGVARKFGRRTADFQREQFAKQVRSSIGVTYAQLERPVLDRVEEFAVRNVDLIKTIPERYFDGVREDVQTAFEEGWHVDDLAARIEREYDLSESNARRIARDQIGKLNAEVNQARQEALGIEGYIWRTLNDDRVRDEHMEREGKKFTWDDPPEDGHPGEPIQCRCYAEPDMSYILGGEL